MKKGKQLFCRLPVVLIPVLVLAVLFYGFFVYRHFSGALAAGAGRELTVDKDLGKDLGTSENPYLIVEVVPNLSCAEVGYLIPGQEPISLYQLGTSTDAIAFLKRMGCNVSTASGSISVSTDASAIMDAGSSSLIRFEDEPRADDASFTPWVKRDTAITAEGYYYRLPAPTGHFDLVDDRYGRKKMKANPNGDGNYDWVTEENTEKIVTDYSADKIWTTRSENSYYEGTRINITNNDVFVKNVLDSTSEEYKVKVVTVTPEDLNNDVTCGLLSQANMIYINGTAHTTDGSADSLVEVWKNYNIHGTDQTKYVMTTDEEANVSFIKNDLPWKACKIIYERMAKAAVTASGAAITNGTYGKPVLVMDGVSDFSGIAERSTGVDKEANNKCLNVYKLYMMLKQYSPSKFYDTFYNPASGEKVKDGTAGGIQTGTYKGQPIWKYNGSDTFFVDGLQAGSSKKDQIAGGVKESWLDESYESAEDSIYVFDKSTSMLDTFLTPYVERSDKYKYNEIVFDWYDDNASDGSKKNNLSSAEILKALFNINLEYKRELNILEIQPTNAFEYDAKSPEKVAYFTKMFPWFEGGSSDIHVTQMATWEFVGNIEDIVSKYDAVYIGALAGTVDVNDRNDSRLNGYTYIPVGDSSGSSQNNSSYKSLDVRYSDNDITRSKYKELKAFMDAGKPIVFQSSFYHGGSTKVTNVAWHNGKDETYMYKLADLANNSAYHNKTLFNYRDFVDKPDEDAVSGMRKATYKDECKLVFYDADDATIYPLEYGYTTSGSDGMIATESYNTYKEEVSGKMEKTLRYRFMIKGLKNETYSVKLYIDSNSDGLYRGSINRPVQYDSSGEPTTETEEVLSSSIRITSEKGNKVSVDNLKANTWYTLSRPLGDNYKGIIPWKLEVSKNTAANSQWSNAVDYTLFKVDAADIEQVNIIQLFTNRYYIPTNSNGYIKKKSNGDLDLDYSGNDKSKSTMNLDTGTVDCNYDNNYQFTVTGDIQVPSNTSSAGNKFKRYLSGVNEFNVNIKFFDCWDIPNIMCGYTKATEGHRNSGECNWGDPNGWWNADPETPFGKPSAKRLTAWLDDQNISMIVFGYKDSHSYPDNAEFHKAMKQYIDIDQKAVIFCHDQVCSYMGGTNGNNTDVNNNDMRFWVGQNRYETTGLWEKETKVPITLNVHGFNIRMRPMNSNGTAITRGGNNDDYTFFDDNNNVINMKMGGSVYKDRDTYRTGVNWPYTTNYVKKLKSGQIKNYPYKIKELVSTGTTHTQYFQLDAENDEITTWFTLSDSDSKIKSTGANAGRGFYSSRDGDTRNSYYIYNKGNITYTGLGHQPNMTNEEVQLFVNTMISSFRSQPEKPYAALVGEDGLAMDKSANSGVDYQVNVVKDEIINVDEQYAVLKFKIIDNSIGLSNRRKYEVMFQYYDENGDLQKAEGVLPFDCRGCTYDSENYMQTPGKDGVRETATGVSLPQSTETVTDATGIKFKVDSNTGYQVCIPLSMFYDLKDSNGNPVAQKVTNDGKKTMYTGSFLYNVQVYSRVATSTYKKNNTKEDSWIQIQEMKQFNLD